MALFTLMVTVVPLSRWNDAFYQPLHQDFPSLFNEPITKFLTWKTCAFWLVLHVVTFEHY